MIRTLKFALRYDPETAYWNKPRKLDWPADKRVAQHDQRLHKTVA